MERPYRTGLMIAWLAMSAAASVSAQEKVLAIKAGESCMSASCHADMGKKKFVHAVAADGSLCILCHQTPEEERHRFKMVAEGGELCAQCHESKVGKKNKHAPVEAGMCLFCHDPHQSDNSKQLNFPPTSELCLNCHDQTQFQDKTVHGPVKEGQCLKCHDPHTSDHPKQLKAAIPDLCFGCHDKPQKDASGRELPPPKVTFDDEGIRHHAPFGIGECLWCHNPHASQNYRLLRNRYPEAFYAAYSKEKYICFDCHDEKAFVKPRTLTDTGFRNGNLNLHYRHVNREKGRTCRACHHHHGSKNDFLIRETVPFGERQIRISQFEKTETGGKCSPTCHTAVRYDRYEPAFNPLKVTPREGSDATVEELEKAGKAQLQDGNVK